jgi:GxxExxY protein
MDDFPFREECYRIIGCSMEVHKALGPGFLEAVYQEALALELAEADIPFVKEKVLDIHYKGKLLEKKYVADYMCFNEVIVELKAVESLSPDHLAQVLNYLKATGKKIGLLINFGSRSLQYKRVIL